MKVSLARYGGLAAAIRRPPLYAESSALPEKSAAELARLVAAIRADPPISGQGPGRTRDAMSYTITLEEDAGETMVLRASDGTMSPTFAALLQWLELNSTGN